MNQIVVITAYKSKKELDFILRKLSRDFKCFVHVDKKAENSLMQLQDIYPNVYFESKYDVYWGGWEHLEAIISLLNCALEFDWQYAHLISGEDIPVKSNESIKELLNNQNGIFIDPFNSSNKGPTDGRRWRYYWPYVRYGWNYKKSTVRLFNLFTIALQVLFLHPRRQSIGEFKDIYYGYIWGTYPRDVIEYIIKYLNDNPEFCGDLRWCKIPEEICFPTVIMNSEFKNRVKHNNLRYWTMHAGDWGPGVLTHDDIKQIRKCDAIFARKMKIGTVATDALIKELETQND